MTSRRSFHRKVFYLIGIALLLLPLNWLGSPATSKTGGGVLARQAREHGLSEADLGKVDPASVTLKLSTFGLRGVATNYLWQKANTYKMKKDWTKLAATLEQIARLEPHFIPVWRHQAWNLSYNVSSEFDDYRGRYQWVIRGIKFLKEGISYNERTPVLHWDVGWYSAQKIGRADESKQFRKIFKADDDYHGSRPPEARDNWLVGKEWFAEAIRLVDQGEQLKGTSPVIFFSEETMCQMNYAESLEADGMFGEKTKIAWEGADRQWNETYGNREIVSSQGIKIRLNDREKLHKLAGQQTKQLDAMAQGIREKIRQERIEDLATKHREAFDADPSERTEEQRVLAREAEGEIFVSHTDVAKRVKGPNRQRAVALAETLEGIERKVDVIGSYRSIVNFEYWRAHARVEKTDEAIAARKAIYLAGKAYAKGDLVGARQHFDEGFALWRGILDTPEFEGLKINWIADDTSGRDWLEIIERYERLLEARDERMPKDFILQDLIDTHRGRVPVPRGTPQEMDDE